MMTTGRGPNLRQKLNVTDHDANHREAYAPSAIIALYTIAAFALCFIRGPLTTHTSPLWFDQCTAAVRGSPFIITVSMRGSES